MNSTVIELTYRNYFFGLIVGGTSLFGIGINFSALWILYYGGKFACSFQQLCFSQCIANFSIQVLFLTFCCPSIMFQLNNFAQNSGYGRILSAMMIFNWHVGVMSHFMITINRMIVLTWPVTSRVFFTGRINKIMIAIVWILCLIDFIPYLDVDECYFAFNNEKFFFWFSPNVCGLILEIVPRYLEGTTLFLIIAIDTWTMTRLIKYKMSKGSTIHVQDIRFFIQAMLQGLLFIWTQVSFFLITPHFFEQQNFEAVFFSNIFAWQFTHVVDGIIIIPFHIGNYMKQLRSQKYDSHTGFSSNKTPARVTDGSYDEKSANKPSLPPIRAE